MAMQRSRFLRMSALMALALSTTGLSQAKTPQHAAAPRPNVVVVLLDDLGFSDIGRFGSEIATPTMDRLAQRGVSMSQFYVNPRCSPTRAALLTGKYPHEVGMGGLPLPSLMKTPPGPYQGYLNASVPTVASRLKEAGYATFMSGKWHLGDAPQNWPRKFGFDRYFGLISGASSYYELVTETMGKRIMADEDTPFTPPAEGFYMTTAITDHAVDYIRTHEQAAPDKPFMLYLAYTAPHWPLHAPDAAVRKYDGVYDKGWPDVRAKRLSRLKSQGMADLAVDAANWPAGREDWDRYPDKAGWARRMQVHAAMVELADAGLARVVETLEQSGDLDNTIILVMSDNGASGEDAAARGIDKPEILPGRQGSYVSIGKEGALMANTPFRDVKGTVFEGSVRSPFIAFWPKGLGRAKGLKSKGYATILDVMPTILDAAGVAPDSGEGRSLLPVLKGKAALKPQPFYWEHYGWRGVRDGPWKLVSPALSKDWLLFNIDRDPGENKNLASSQKALVARLSANWENWAKATHSESLDPKFLRMLDEGGKAAAKTPKAAQ